MYKEPGEIIVITWYLFFFLGVTEEVDKSYWLVLLNKLFARYGLFGRL
ncbi:hypothetical protein JOD17_000914 [Geomicrobium sediminis]|uniref:Uncharacterized protein n=1 Tax=Geomicrobium sediminis TaxID=1347788 RepID=A0ABS2P8T3_9BACL|nr:hypothetical protein [Geomicrobium sediminis]